MIDPVRCRVHFLHIIHTALQVRSILIDGTAGTGIKVVGITFFMQTLKKNFGTSKSVR